MIIQLVTSRTEYKPKEFGSRSHSLFLHYASISISIEKNYKEWISILINRKKKVMTDL